MNVSSNKTFSAWAKVQALGLHVTIAPSGRPEHHGETFASDDGAIDVGVPSAGQDPVRIDGSFLRGFKTAGDP